MIFGILKNSLKDTVKSIDVFAICQFLSWLSSASTLAWRFFKVLA